MDTRRICSVKLAGVAIAFLSAISWGMCAPAVAQIAFPTPGQISAAVAKGVQHAGQPQGLLLPDNASQFFQALGMFSAQQGKLQPGTQVLGGGFQVRIFTPLEWVAQQSSDAAGAGQSFNLENVTADMLRPVLHIVATPSTPPDVGPNMGLGVSPVIDVVLKDASRRYQLRPLNMTQFTYQNLQGLTVEFSLDDLARLREGNPEFYVEVAGTGGNQKEFKIKRKHFAGLP